MKTSNLREVSVLTWPVSDGDCIRVVVSLIVIAHTWFTSQTCFVVHIYSENRCEIQFPLPQAVQAPAVSWSFSGEIVRVCKGG